MKVAVLTHLASPYQVELFNTIARSDRVAFTAVYLFESSPGRRWKSRPIEHEHLVLSRGGATETQAENALAEADLAVFNYYNHPFALHTIRARHASTKPWCFWGERPGFRLPGWLGILYRRWRLAPLLSSMTPIWGIGRFAVEQYRREFGSHRQYCNIPYFSNLDRFHPSDSTRGRVQTGRTNFLFSGSLIRRKGVDVLARAFLRLAKESDKIYLRIMGEGEMLGQLKSSLASVSNQVEFLGFRDWDELPAEYHRADVLCVPSRHDGWGLVVAEGLAAGLPVIGTTQTGAALELVEPGKNGWQTAPGDEQALFEAMRAAAGMNDIQFKDMRSNALASVKRHTLDRGAELVVSAVEECLGIRPPENRMNGSLAG